MMMRMILFVITTMSTKMVFFVFSFLSETTFAADLACVTRTVYLHKSGLAEEMAWLETPAVYGGPSRHRAQVFGARLRYSLRSERVAFAD